MMGMFRKLFGKAEIAPPRPDPDAQFEALSWLEANQNEFGVRVLDCRPIAETFTSVTENPDGTKFFGSPAARSGEQFRGLHPEDALRLPCRLVYPLKGPLPEGMVFQALVFEVKWNIYHFDRVLYFVRSWTGQLRFSAVLAESKSELNVLEIEAWPGDVLGDDGIAIRQVDFLIRSHLFGQPLPHPVSPLRSKKAIAAWSFMQFGRYGRFAAVGEPAAPMT